MSFSNKLQQEKPWAILGWARKQWKARKLWKQAGVSEGKKSQLLQTLDHSTIQEIKDYAMTELLTEKIFGQRTDLAVYIILMVLTSNISARKSYLVELMIACWKYIIIPALLLLLGN